MTIKLASAPTGPSPFHPARSPAPDFFQEIGPEFSKILAPVRKDRLAPAQLIKRLLIGLPLVGLGWIGILAAVMWITGQAPAALVILPPSDLLDHLPPGTAVVSIGPYSITLRGGDDLVTALYQAGATLVLPAGLTGCLPQSPPVG